MRTSSARRPTRITRQWLITERGFRGDGPPPEIPDQVRVELAEKYLSAFEQITGAPLSLEVGPVRERVLATLRHSGLLR